jgi:hypothetical protein
MRYFPVFSLVLVLVCAGAANAAITCSDSNPRNVTGLNVSGGCTIGGLTFSNFQVLPAAGNPTPEIDLVSAIVDPMGFVDLQFNPNMSAPPSGGNQDIHFFFSVTGGIDQIDLAVGGVNATIIERACSTPLATNNPTCPAENVLANIIGFSAPPGPNTAISAVFATTPTVYIYKDVGVSPNQPNSTGGGLTTFTQSFHQSQVPEPVTSGLLGSGLLAGVVFRRWRKQ